MKLLSTPLQVRLELEEVQHNFEVSLVSQWPLAVEITIQLGKQAGPHPVQKKSINTDSLPRYVVGFPSQKNC